MQRSQDTQQPSQLTVMELVEQTMSTTGELAQKQIELLRVELLGALTEERNRMIELGVGALAGIVALGLLLLAAVLGLGQWLGHPALVAVGLAGVFATATAVLIPVSLRKHRDLLTTSRRIATEEITWAKQQLSETSSLTSPKMSNGSDDAASR